MNCDCGKALDKRNVYGLCRSCSAKAHSVNLLKGRSHHHMRWCPEELRGQYRELRDASFSAVEAKRILLDHMAARKVQS